MDYITKLVLESCFVPFSFCSTTIQ